MGNCLNKQFLNKYLVVPIAFLYIKIDVFNIGHTLGVNATWACAFMYKYAAQRMHLPKFGS